MYVEYQVASNVTTYTKENSMGLNWQSFKMAYLVVAFQCSSFFLRIHSFYKYIIDIVFAGVFMGGLHKKLLAQKALYLFWSFGNIRFRGKAEYHLRWC